MPVGAAFFVAVAVAIESFLPFPAASKPSLLDDASGRESECAYLLRETAHHHAHRFSLFLKRRRKRAAR